MEKMSRQVKELKLGEKLRQLRQMQKVSLDDLADASGISAENLLSYEEDRDAPSVSELLAIAKTLGVAMGHFFLQTTAPRRLEVVRAHERWRVERSPSDESHGLTYSYEALSYRLTEKLMLPFHVELAPGAIHNDVTPSQHDGEEFLFVLEGSLDLTVGDEHIELEQGDSLYFDSRMPHIIRCKGAAPARVLAIVATGLPTSADTPMSRAKHFTL